VDRKSERQVNALTVRLCCGRCERKRVIGELYGSDPDTPTTYWSPQASGALPHYGRAVYWRCRCGSEHPIRAEKLRAAFSQAAARPRKRDRVIVLPQDVRAAAA
jgi:hypothetical protein